MKTTKNYLYKSVEMSRESRSLQLLQKAGFLFSGTADLVSLDVIRAVSWAGIMKRKELRLHCVTDDCAAQEWIGDGTNHEIQKIDRPVHLSSILAYYELITQKLE